MEVAKPASAPHQEQDGGGGRGSGDTSPPSEGGAGVANYRPPDSWIRLLLEVRVRHETLVQHRRSQLSRCHMKYTPSGIQPPGVSSHAVI